jgi:hypothetical protein
VCVCLCLRVSVFCVHVRVCNQHIPSQSSQFTVKVKQNFVVGNLILFNLWSFIILLTLLSHNFFVYTVCTIQTFQEVQKQKPTPHFKTTLRFYCFCTGFSCYSNRVAFLRNLEPRRLINWPKAAIK